MGYPESWQETAMLSIRSSTAVMNFAILTDSFDINNGEKDIEGKPTVSGGRIAVWTPEKDTEVTCKIYQVGVGKVADTSADGFWQFFQPQSASVDTFPQVASVSRSRTTTSLAVMWATSYPGTAFAATVGSAAAYRLVFRNAYVTKDSHSFSPSDGLMGDLTIKVPAFDKNGNANITIESTDGSAVLTAK